MTDNEVVKALECCTDMECSKCPMNYDDCEERDFETLVKRAIPIFNRQKAEIERLEDILNAVDNTIGYFKAKTIKEFAERLKDEWLAVILLKNKSDDYAEGYHDALCYVEDQIDKLVKEMVGENND